MAKKTQEIIDKKLPIPVETEEENRCMISVLNLLAPGCLQKRSWMRSWKNLPNLG